MKLLLAAILFLLAIKTGIYLVLLLDITEEKDNGNKR